jgi:hypothetical protein
MFGRSLIVDSKVIRYREMKRLNRNETMSFLKPSLAQPPKKEIIRHVITDAGLPYRSQFSLWRGRVNR